MRIDAHQHFWKYSPAAYDWISDRNDGVEAGLPSGKPKAAARRERIGRIDCPCRPATRWRRRGGCSNSPKRPISSKVSSDGSTSVLPICRRSWKLLRIIPAWSAFVTWCRGSPTMNSCCAVTFSAALLVLLNTASPTICFFILGTCRSPQSLCSGYLSNALISITSPNPELRRRP